MKLILVVAAVVESLLLAWTGLFILGWFRGHYAGETPGPPTVTPWESFWSALGPWPLIDIPIPAALLIWFLAVRRPGRSLTRRL
jgi:hypothetical protein